MPARHSLSLVAGAVALLAACGGGGSTADTGTTESALVVGALQPAAESLRGNVTCRNLEIGPLLLDTVTVPADAACRLLGTRLVGSIQVGRNASVEAVDVSVNGNLQADGAAHVSLSGASTVGGSVQIKQGGSASVVDARITGDLQVDAMRGAVLLDSNRLGGNLQAVANRGGLTVTGNRMIGNLQCKENVPAPVAANNVAASIEGQCAVGGGSSPAPTPAPGNLSGNITCRNLAIGAASLDTVFVPDNATCTLAGTRLVGSIKVGRNATLHAQDVRVNGDLQADGSASVTVQGASSFGGSVQIKQGGSASVASASIAGDLQFDAQRGPVAAAGNRIGGNLQAMSNAGGVALNGNAIDGNLQCKGNAPAPQGSGNTAASKEDQCAAL